MLIKGRQAKHEVKAQPRSWYSIQAAGDVATVRIYDEISWFGVTAEDFANDLDRIEAAAIHLHLSSPGGDVWDGMAIYNALKQHKASVITFIDGVAASIASVIALAGDEVRMASNGLMMIHNAWTLAAGNAADMIKAAELLQKVDGTIAGTYAAKTGKDAAEFKALMNEETWFTAQEAKEIGFVDEIYDGKPEDEPQARFDLSIFRNAPKPEPAQEPDSPISRQMMMKRRLAVARRELL